MPTETFTNGVSGTDTGQSTEFAGQKQNQDLQGQSQGDPSLDHNNKPGNENDNDADPITDDVDGEDADSNPSETPDISLDDLVDEDNVGSDDDETDLDGIGADEPDADNPNDLERLSDREGASQDAPSFLLCVDPNCQPFRSD